ncbi:hypothetical protein [Gayadomonas joobiniege]|uniref:hypothetical protein n=1 Tax=Gayadomonas joobiniege TaxID=1234606 RepID=UPI0003785C0D|nr:hypothetical protein [Gayadomonas joobiniege]
MNFKSWLIASVCCCSSFLLNAETYFSGFGSLAGYQANGDTLSFKTDVASPYAGGDNDFELADLTNLGLQVNHILNPEWQLVGQVLLQKGRSNQLIDRVTIASLNYTPNANWMFRFGRFSARNVWFSDSRYVNYAQTSVYPVSGFYNQIQTAALDGAEITYTNRIDEWLISWNLYAGQSNHHFYNDSGNFENRLRPVIGAAIEIDHLGWRIRAAHTYSKLAEQSFERDISAFLSAFTSVPPLYGLPAWHEADDLQNETKYSDEPIEFTSVSFEYKKNSHLFRFEIGHLYTDSGLIINNTSGYLQYAYQINQYTPFISVSAIDSTRGYEPYSWPSPDVFNAVTDVIGFDSMQGLLGVMSVLQNRSEQQSLSLGLRYDLNHSVALKAQVEHFWIAQDGIGLWARDNLMQEPDRQIDVIAVSLDWIF